MIRMKGNDDFNGVFDWYEWSAPVYENPYEIITAFNSLNIVGKTAEHIFFIGSGRGPLCWNNALECYDYMNCSFTSETLEDSSLAILRENTWFPCELTVCEPIVLLFTDGTTFEFLPMGSRCRMSTNCIPAGQTEGINHSNIDARPLFDPRLSGCVLKDFSFQKLEDISHHYHVYGKLKHSRSKRLSFLYDFKFQNGELSIESKYSANFKVRHYSYDFYFNAPYPAIKQAVLPDPYVKILPGSDPGATCWITPKYDDAVYNGLPLVDRLSPNGFSVCIWELVRYLGYYLNKYYDKTIQQKDWQDGFDENGWNYYSVAAIKEMLAEISADSDRIEKDCCAPRLKPLLDSLSVYDHIGDSPDIGEHTNEDIDAVLIVTVDFYRRFCKRLKRMLKENPLCNVISFAGP